MTTKASSTPSTSAFDLSALIDQDTAPCYIVDDMQRPVIGSDEKPWFVTMAGPAHPKTTEVRNRSIRQVLKQRRKTQKALENVTDVEIEEVAMAQLEPIYARVVGWGPIAINGTDFPYTAKNAETLVRTSTLIRDQLDKFLKDEASFLGKSKTPS